MGGYAGCEDTYFRADQGAGISHGTAADLIIGTPAANRSNAVLRFQAIPALGLITGVVLRLTLVSGAEDPATGPWIKLARILDAKPWEEGDTHWDYYDDSESLAWGTAGCQGSGVDYDATVWTTIDPHTVLTVADQTLDLTFNATGIAYVNANYQGAASVNGFVLLTGEGADGWTQTFHSSEGATASKRPKLTITYSPGSGGRKRLFGWGMKLKALRS